jgi:hypothetical protein
MAEKLSAFLAVSPKAFQKNGILDSLIGVDTHLFLDPHLLRKTTIPEFRKSRQKIEKYYSDILRLLDASKQKGDRAWREAYARLIFKELTGTAIGYGVTTSNGNAIGPVLGRRLVDAAEEIISMGIKDPEIFELLGLFEEGFGADRLSDMTIRIVRDDLFKFTERITNKLKITRRVTVRIHDKAYSLPRGPSGSRFLVFLPKTLLRDLPVALTREDIDHVVATNEALRSRLNQLIGRVWKRGVRIPKGTLRYLILKNPAHLKMLIESYKANKASSYDFEQDPAGQTTWYDIGQKSAANYPIRLALGPRPTIQEVETVVKQIIDQFKRNVEVNGLNECLFVKEAGVYEVRHERYSQLLFYSAADTYCKANNVDLSREPNAGNGPVDFKFSRGYELRVLVEIKLSSNKMLVHGFKMQLPTYAKSEQAKRSIYVILQVGRSSSSIKTVNQIQKRAEEQGQKVPTIVVIDARIKPSASKRR